ncbi:MAG: N-acetyltransferase [Clostridia bacterium]|nr:N-acetyltransferase [Clostridia bacterium]
MIIRIATAADLQRIMEIYGIAQEFMIRSGNPGQWARSYPPRELIGDDIRRGICHVICDNGIIRGVFALLTEPEPTYSRIEGGQWLNDGPYVTIHRVASDGQAHGIFTCAADYCKQISKNVRVDTHEKNLPMQHQIEKNGFKRCGIVYVRDGTPRIAYHWTEQ